MRCTWPPIAAGPHYSPMQENAHPGEKRRQRKSEKNAWLRLQMDCIYEKSRERRKEFRIQRYIERFGFLWIGYGHAARRTDKKIGTAPCPLKALLLSEYSLSWHWLSPTIYKRMPIGFYLVASNKPLWLTCMQTTLHDPQTQTVMSAASYQQHQNSWNCSEKLLSVYLIVQHMKSGSLQSITVCLRQLFGFFYLQNWNWDL